LIGGEERVANLDRVLAKMNPIWEGEENSDTFWGDRRCEGQGWAVCHSTLCTVR
jgi:hypothetical protein